MLKAQQFNIADSNIANLGSDLEKKVKETAAQSEAAWRGCGEAPGLTIWRIEQFHVVAWPRVQYGQFFGGDSYIVLHTWKVDGEPKLNQDIFFWIGSESSQDEYGTAAYKTVELDDYFKGTASQHREMQGHESEKFLSLFPAYQVLQGGCKSGFHHVSHEDYKHRLLHIKGTKTNVVVREVPIARESLNNGDVFVLDMGLHLYQFNAPQAGIFEKNKAALLCRAIDDQRGGKPELHVFEDLDGRSDRDARVFWEKIGGSGDLSAPTLDTMPAASKRLFRLSDESGSMQFTECSEISREQLDSRDVFVFDAGFEIFVWIGSGATQAEKTSGLAAATEYLHKNDRTLYLPITVCREGSESEVFLAAL